MRSDLSETGNPSNPRIIQYTFSEDHPNALQQANILHRAICMHNPNFKAFLRKLNECKNPPTPEQFAELEAIIKREEDFIMPLARAKYKQAGLPQATDKQILRWALLDPNAAMGPGGNAIAIMKRFLPGLHNTSKFDTPRYNAVVQIRVDIMRKLIEEQDDLSYGTADSLSKIGVLVQDKRRGAGTTRIIWIEDRVSSKEQIIREFQREMEALRLTPAQIHYLKMSASQASFRGINEDIEPHLKAKKTREGVLELNTMKIILDNEGGVFLEQSGIYAVEGLALSYKARTDLSNIRTEKILVGNGGQHCTFIQEAPLTTRTMVTSGYELNQELLAAQGIIATQQPQEASQRIMHEIANDYCTHITHLYQSISRYMINQEATSDPVKKLRFLRDVLPRIDSSLEVITALEFTDQVMGLPESTDALSQQRAAAARQSDDHHLGSGQHRISGTQERIERQNSRTFVESLEESQKLSDPNAHKTASRS